MVAVQAWERALKTHFNFMLVSRRKPRNPRDSLQDLFDMTLPTIPYRRAGRFVEDVLGIKRHKSMRSGVFRRGSSPQLVRCFSWFTLLILLRLTTPITSQAQGDG